MDTGAETNLPDAPIKLRGARVYPGFLDRAAQEALVHRLRDVAAAAPFFHPVTSRGQKMSVRMTSAGRLGWVSDRKGYRYEPRHPTGADWPAIPQAVLDIWSAVSGTTLLPDTCLINFYGEGARMGMHQDADEADLRQPVVSISLGDDALFRLGNTHRGGKTESLWLHSGDVVVLGEAARMLYHGIDRIRFGSSNLLENNGRLNLTLRVAGAI